MQTPQPCRRHSTSGRNVALAILLLLSSSTVLAAQPRIALVIGNSSYHHYSPLQNPVNDAEDIRDDLLAFGFRVIYGVDLTLDETVDIVERFGSALAGSNAVGLFYYAGHGVQIDGENYIVPSDARMQRQSRVPFESYPVSSVLTKMGARADGAVNLIILDACRNNPFPVNSRGLRRGLARVSAPASSLILYATQPGETASDNVAGRNGLFTKHLRLAIKRPGIDVEQGFTDVVRAVYSESNGRQYPWKEGVLLDSFIFNQTSDRHSETHRQQAESPVAPEQTTIAEAAPVCADELVSASPISCLFSAQPPTSSIDSTRLSCAAELTTESPVACLFDR